MNISSYQIELTGGPVNAWLSQMHIIETSASTIASLAVFFFFSFVSNLIPAEFPTRPGTVTLCTTTLRYIAKGAEFILEIPVSGAACRACYCTFSDLRIGYDRNCENNRREIARLSLPRHIAVRRSSWYYNSNREGKGTLKLLLLFSLTTVFVYI